MSYLIVRHKVQDYAKWKPVFDEDSARRQASGSKGGRLFRNADNPNEIIILMEWDNVENAHKFAHSDALREKMQAAGVTERPDIFFINESEKLTA